MARDTRGRVPGETTDLRRISLTSTHWRQSRWLLAAEAGVVAVIVVGTLIVTRPGHGDPVVAGIRLTAALGWTLLAVAAAAGLATTSRGLALTFTAAVSLAAIVLVIVVAVAAAHHAHPLGSTAPVLLMWAVLFCYNLAVAIWLVPDHIEGPAWVLRRRSQHPGTPGRSV
jgi:hypothetical protein